MADYPCDVHRARYPGYSNRVYLNVYREEEKQQYKGSVCGDCLADLVSDWLGFALYQTDAGWAIPDEDGAPPLESRWMPSERAVRPLNGSTRF